MQKLFGIAIEKHPLRYALFKIAFAGIIPFCLTFFLYEWILFVCLFCYLLAVLLLTLLSLSFTKKSLWQWCSGSQVQWQSDFKKSKTLILISLLAVFSLIFLQLFRQSPRWRLREIVKGKNIASPISLPEKAYYVKNMEQYKQDPVDYVMQLFDKYDIVVICERWHTEYTQWEFFSKVILNDTFARKVEHVFTEFGQAQHQEVLDNYMQTRFSTEEDLQRATAQIVRENGGMWPLWSNTNIYDFILNLHQFNETRDSVDRINHFFTDMPTDWNVINTPAQWNYLSNYSDRDSIMASNVLNRYENLNPKKCLLITNTRHAWNYGENEIAYISKKCPDKMAVVLINGTTQFMSPMMNGTLDEAALEITDSIWAIDFQESPLGNVSFDLMPIKRDKCVYKDLFAGMVYCQHPSNWGKSDNYPFMLDNYKDTLLKRSAMVGEDYLKMTTDAIEKGYCDQVEKMFGSPFLWLYNLAFLGLHSIILIYLLINLLVLLCKKQKKTELTQ
jgi:hypothetical protein